ncbi:MAG: DUF5522 domain-containing protein [Bdellovibrionales bacterium]
MRTLWMAIHELADEKGVDLYVDPDTNYSVFTRGYLLRKGTCCKSQCRHCPYGEMEPPTIDKEALDSKTHTT